MKRIQSKNQLAYPLHSAYEEGFNSRIILHIPFIQLMKRIQLKNHPAYPLHSAYEEDSTQESSYISSSSAL